MKLPIFYRCPAGHHVAVIRDALNDAPDKLPVPERSIFSQCDYCEEESVGGVCVLSYEVRV